MTILFKVIWFIFSSDLYKRYEMLISITKNSVEITTFQVAWASSAGSKVAEITRESKDPEIQTSNRNRGPVLYANYSVKRFIGGAGEIRDCVEDEGDRSRRRPDADCGLLVDQSDRSARDDDIKPPRNYGIYRERASLFFDESMHFLKVT